MVITPPAEGEKILHASRARLRRARRSPTTKLCKGSTTPTAYPQPVAVPYTASAVSRNGLFKLPIRARSLKIENRRTVEALPRILLTAMGRPMTVVMVARGDLGVEIGFERMAEIQEEILWICEAAHVPVIWATQVLESLVKRGLPSRAEVTDAAMSGRAECVMLNKGPHILLALDFLCDVLARMEGHQTKKSALMRKLSVAELAWK